jgi:hypothetical protein
MAFVTVIAKNISIPRVSVILYIVIVMSYLTQGEGEVIYILFVVTQLDNLQHDWFLW